MATKNNIFEDLARVSSSVASVAFESVKGIQDSAKGRVASAARSVDLVTRDEFEAYKAIATKAKTDAEMLVKEFSEVKKQFQAIASNMDVIKELLAQNGTGSIEENNKRIYADLKVFYEGVEGRMHEMSDMVNQQSSRIDEVNERFEGVKADALAVAAISSEAGEDGEKPKVEKKPRAKKAANTNNASLFDIPNDNPENEQN
jgi:BMFP domain-containing protein YqiC